MDDEIGDVYQDELVLSIGNPARFTNHSLKLRRLKIIVSATTVKAGRQGHQEFPLSASNARYYFQNVDMADLWFRDDDAASTVYALGTTRNGGPGKE